MLFSPCLVTAMARRGVFTLGVTMRKILLALALLPSVALAEFPAVRNDNLGTVIIPTNGRPGPMSVTDTGALLTRELPSGSSKAKTEDSAHISTDVGSATLVVRDDDLSSDSSNDGDYQFAKSDSVGRLYVNPFGGDVNRFLVSCSSVTTGTTDSSIVPAVGGNRIYVTSLSCSNTAAVASVLTLKDGATGKWVYYIGAVAAVNNVFHVQFPTPIRGTANTAVNFALTTTATSTTCCATYFTSGL